MDQISARNADRLDGWLKRTSFCLMVDFQKNGPLPGRSVTQDLFECGGQACGVDLFTVQMSGFIHVNRNGVQTT